MDTAVGPIRAESEAWGTQCGLLGEGEQPHGPWALTGSPMAGLPGCHGDQWKGSQTSRVSILEGRDLGPRGSRGPGTLDGEGGGQPQPPPALGSGTHLVTQHEPIAVGLGDRVPAYQHAAGGGGQGRHVGGARGRD